MEAQLIRQADYASNAGNKHWGERLADQVLKQFPDQEVYICAAGISPSGTVHFGNFRDLFTPYVVAQALAKKGKKTRLLFSWDDFDRFRKVPKNIDQSFARYVGLPYTEVPCPDGKYTSYAEKFEKEFEASMNALNICPEYIYQTEMYRSGVYDDLIILSLQHRKAIADILLSFMPEKTKLAKNIIDKEYREQFYPISLYSRFTGKDNTKILDYDGASTVTYTCLESGNTESVDITKDHIVKLAWKIDWAMRWYKEKVVFEPAGADHASPGGSFDTSSRIVKEIFAGSPPVFVEYKFVGLQGFGSKMSGSKGNVIAPKDLLEIYTPEMLKWLYADKPPSRSFELSFGKGVIRQYDEFDRAEAALKKGTLDEIAGETLRLSGVGESKEASPVPFRQLVGLGQIVQWDEAKLRTILYGQGQVYDVASTQTRLIRAKNWLEKYNKEEAITLLSAPNTDYLATMSVEQIERVKRLHDFLANHQGAAVQEIEAEVYAIPKRPGLDTKELVQVQRIFFKDIYQLLIGKAIGPRLSTFLWAVDRQKVLKLLHIK